MSASRPISAAMPGSIAATAWWSCASIRITRDGSAARNPTGKTVTSTIRTSPKTRPAPAPRRPARSRRRAGSPRSGPQRPEERLLVALVGGVLARLQCDVGGGAGQPLAFRGADRREDRDLGDLVGRHREACTAAALPTRGPVDGRRALRASSERSELAARLLGAGGSRSWIASSRSSTARACSVSPRH